MARIVDADLLLEEIMKIIDRTEAAWIKTLHETEDLDDDPDEVLEHCVWMDAYDLVRDFGKTAEEIEDERDMQYLAELISRDGDAGYKG